MNISLALGSFVLAAVFAAAGLAKLMDRRGTREASRAFGVPERLAAALAVGLPLAELVVAMVLLPAATRWWASVAALALLLVFCGAIARAMARGEAPECHCFGQLHSAPVGWRTLARNGILVVLALAIVVLGRGDPGPSAFAWVSRLDGLEWLVVALASGLAAVVAVGGYAVAHVLRSYGRVLVRLDAVEARLRAAGLALDEPDELPALGLEPGAQAPMFWLLDLEGGRVSLGDLLEAGRPVLLVFTSPRCGSCSVLMPTVARWQREHVDELTIALLNEGELDPIRAEAVRHGLENVLVDERLSAYEAYEANGTPSAVLVAPDGTIASWLAAGSEWIETLVEQALGNAGETPGLPVGAELPELIVELLDGATKPLRELVEGPTVLLFWNPSCGFCRSMRDELAAWEEAPPRGAPRLVVVSTGAPDDVRAERFTSHVVLDPSGDVSASLGAQGTPMAVLVDATGRIASPLAVGGEQALGLLGPAMPALAE